MNPNAVKVWPCWPLQMHFTRTVYMDENGVEFTGTREQALAHYQQLYPTKSVILHTLPKKRK